MKHALIRIATAARGAVPDALMLSGATAVSYGTWLVSEPGGFIVAGLFALAGGWLTARGGK